MKYGELKRKLRKAGCYEIKGHKGSPHEHWYSPKTGETFPVGRHNGEEVKNGTLKSILKAAGL